MADIPEDPGNPYTPPAASVEASMRADAEGALVQFAPADRLPKICLRCGVKKGVKRHPQRLDWAPPETYLALALGVLPYLVILAFVRRIANVQLPLCDPCHAIWRNAGLVRGGLIVAATVAFIVTLTVALNDAPVAGTAVGIASLVAVVLAWRRFLPPNRLRVRRIGRGVVQLAGVHGRAAEAIDAMSEEGNA
jgi:hypothetical protein